MTTKIYGTSDDLIEFEGDVYGEVGAYNHPTLVMCSDGTMLEIRHEKGGLAIWGIQVIRRGDKLLGIDVCDDEGATPYSDVASFADGLKWAFSASEYGKVK